MAMGKERLVALVTAAQSGDGNATNELFNAFYNDLYYFVYLWNQKCKKS